MCGETSAAQPFILMTTLLQRLVPHSLLNCVVPIVLAMVSIAAPVAYAAAPTALWSAEGRKDISPWAAFGDGAQVSYQSARGGGSAAVRFQYRLGGPLQLLVMPITPGALAGGKGLELQLSVDQPLALVVSLEEQGGGRWTTPMMLAAGARQILRLSLADFQLAVDASAPPDANGHLDIDRVRQVALIDAAVFIGAGGGGALSYFDLEAGPRQLLVHELQTLHDAPVRREHTPAELAGLEADVPLWMVFGADAAFRATDGLELKYERRSGHAMTALRPLPAGRLAGSRGLRLDLSSSEPAKLKLTLEQVDGAKFETTLSVASGEAVKAYAVAAKEFKRADNSGTRAEKPDWSLISQLALTDTVGLFSSRSRNRLVVAGLAGDGAVATTTPRIATTTASTVSRGAPSPATVSVDTPGWSRWTKRLQSVHTGPYSLVGDPSVMRDGDLLRMVYNCFDPQRKRGAICMATSRDGFAWNDVNTGDSLPGRILRTRPGKWDDAQETPILIKWKDEYLLYFVGYRDRGGFIKSFPAYVGMAWSKDLKHWDRGDAEPVIGTSPDSWDHDAISSPSVVEYDGKLVMLYTAHCWTGKCPKGPGMSMMAATSTDGRTWTKVDKPVLTKADFPQAKDGIAEAEVSRGPDGRYYLFDSLMYGDDGHEIGVAVAPSPFGPWRINPMPIVRKSANGFDAVGPIAPTVVYDGDRVRMWFHGFSRRNTIEIGYAEAPWPLLRP